MNHQAALWVRIFVVVFVFALQNFVVNALIVPFSVVILHELLNSLPQLNRIITRIQVDVLAFDGLTGSSAPLSRPRQPWP